MIENWSKKRVTVMGLGRFGGGVGVTRWLAGRGARVTVADHASPERLADSLAQIDGLGVALHLGEHDERDFSDADLVVVNPAVPDSSPFLQAARAAGVPVTTEINLFVERCPARCVGVTGSVGKSTIAAMIGHILTDALPDRRVWLGGNIGRCLLDDLVGMMPDDVVVLELSSFQLQRTPVVRWSPHVAVISNVTPNHLDRHGTFAAYLSAKLNILRFQDPSRDVIVVQDVPELRHNLELLFGDVAGVWRYALDDDTPRAVMQSTSAIDCDDKRLCWQTLELRVPGRHNRENAAAALTASAALGVTAEVALAALACFEALPHRLQCVAQLEGVRYFDDSKSTTPEAAITAMNAVGPPLLLILGGYDKGIDLSAAARAAAGVPVEFSACIGQTGRDLCEAIRAGGASAEYFDTLEGAVRACRARARPGDSVLLSPACASWDQFVDFRARGEAFARLIGGDDANFSGADSGESGAPATGARLIHEAPRGLKPAALSALRSRRSVSQDQSTMSPDD